MLLLLLLFCFVFFVTEWHTRVAVSLAKKIGKTTQSQLEFVKKLSWASGTNVYVEMQFWILALLDGKYMAWNSNNFSRKTLHDL